MRHKILLVDDDHNLLEGLKRALRKNPYDVLTATSAEDALRILQNRPVDAVISDQDMPGMSGANFLAKVHEQYPETVRFMLTGRATLAVAIKAINEGAISHFFTKPWDHVDLVATLKQTLRQKDLIKNAMQLLQISKRQSTVIEHLERKHSGITKVEKDANGSVLLEEESPNYEDLLREIGSQVSGAERQIQYVTDWNITKG